jgi:hypothetical protein
LAFFIARAGDDNVDRQYVFEPACSAEQKIDEDVSFKVYEKDSFRLTNKCKIESHQFKVGNVLVCLESMEISKKHLQFPIYLKRMTMEHLNTSRQSLSYTLHALLLKYQWIQQTILLPPTDNC